MPHETPARAQRGGALRNKASGATGSYELAYGDSVKKKSRLQAATSTRQWGTNRRASSGRREGGRGSLWATSVIVRHGDSTSDLSKHRFDLPRPASLHESAVCGRSFLLRVHCNIGKVTLSACHNDKLKTDVCRLISL